MSDQKRIILSSLGVVQAQEAAAIKDELCRMTGRQDLKGVRVGLVNTAADIIFIKMHVRMAEAWWKRQGAETVAISLKDDPALVKKQIEGVEVLYVGSGNTYHLMYWLQKSGVAKYLAGMLDGLVYIGASAGSIVAGPSIRTALLTADHNPEKGRAAMEGLGIVPFMVWPHYSWATNFLARIGRPFWPKIVQQELGEGIERIANGGIITIGGFKEGRLS